MRFQKWKAYNLMWNPEEFQNIKDVRVDAKSVWRPDILLFNRHALLYKQQTKIDQKF